jgi:beta-glucanase (GH16 family)
MSDGGAGTNAQTNLHSPATNGDAWQLGYNNRLAANASFFNDYHVFGNIWSQGKIQFTIDGAIVRTISPSNLQSGQTWPFDSYQERLFLDLQLGAFGGAVDNATLPHSMLVDWVSEYQ